MVKPAKPSKYKDAEFMRETGIYIYRRYIDILKKYYYFDEDASQNATRKKADHNGPPILVYQEQPRL